MVALYVMQVLLVERGSVQHGYGLQAVGNKYAYIFGGGGDRRMVKISINADKRGRWFMQRPRKMAIIIIIINSV